MLPMKIIFASRTEAIQILLDREMAKTSITSEIHPTREFWKFTNKENYFGGDDPKMPWVTKSDLEFSATIEKNAGRYEVYIYA